jgi:hypothetical protein
MQIKGLIHGRGGPHAVRRGEGEAKLDVKSLVLHVGTSYIAFKYYCPLTDDHSTPYLHLFDLPSSVWWQGSFGDFPRLQC